MKDKDLNYDGIFHTIESAVKKILQAKGTKTKPSLSLETSLTLDLGLDSIDMLELGAFLDKEFHIHLLQEEVIKCHHMHELVNLVRETLKLNDLENLKRQTIEERPLTKEELEEIEKYWINIRSRTGLRKAIGYAGANLFRFLFKTYWNLKVKGEGNLPKEGSFILCANHTSHLDNLALIFASKRPFYDFAFLGAKDYFFKRAFFSGFLQTLFNVVPFDRSGSFLSFRKNLAYLEEAKKCSKVIVLFPEGTRSITGKMNDFKLGAALFADHLRLPVIPAYIEGAYALLPKDTIFPKSGKITIYFGKPVKMDNPYEDYSDPKRYDFYHHFMTKLRNAILHLKPEEDSKPKHILR